MKVAYFSPLNPLKSGISDYSEELLPFLGKDMDIDIWVKDFRPSNRLIKKFKIINYGWAYKLRKLKNYDAIIYNIGNNPHFHSSIYDTCLKYPGVVIWHDFVLYFLVTGYWLDDLKDRKGFLRELYKNFGNDGVIAGKELLNSPTPPLQFKNPKSLPLVKTLLEKSKGVIAHSNYTKNLLCQSGGSPNKVAKINQLLYKSNDAGKVDIASLRLKYGIPADCILLGSFGYIAPTKRNDVIIHAVNEINKTRKEKIYYLMVGEGDFVDSFLSPFIKKTGFVSLEQFDNLIHCCDITINLRHPSMGETSASLLRMMTVGKPSVVSNDAWFSELPDHVVCKVPIEPEVEKASLTTSISRLVEDQVYRDQLGQAGKQYIFEQHNPEKIAKEIKYFLEHIYLNKSANNRSLLDDASNTIRSITGDDMDYECTQDLMKPVRSILE